MRHVGYGRARAGSVVDELDREREVTGCNLWELWRGAASKARVVDEECGSSLIELALVLPIVFLMTFGLINFALVMFGVNNIQYASRSAMRYACIHSSTSLLPATTQSVSGMIQPFLFQYPKNVTSTTVTYGTTGNVVGSTVGVAVTITYTIRLPGYTLERTYVDGTGERDYHSVSAVICDCEVRSGWWQGWVDGAGWMVGSDPTITSPAAW